jgi:Transposase
MKYALGPRPDAPSGGLSAGIDWASADHAVCVVDAAGGVVIRFSVAHTAEGLKALVRGLARAGVAEVAIERGDGPVVDALLAAGVTVVVITPRQIKNLRSRYGSAGNKDDRFDAYVLADVLRTDRARPPSRCGRPAGPARTWSGTGSPSATSCALTFFPRSPLRLACSASSTRRSAWLSWPASTARTGPTGCRRSDWPPGWKAPDTAAAPARPSCISG